MFQEKQLRTNIIIAHLYYTITTVNWKSTSRYNHFRRLPWGPLVIPVISTFSFTHYSSTTLVLASYTALKTAFPRALKFIFIVNVYYQDSLQLEEIVYCQFSAFTSSIFWLGFWVALKPKYQITPPDFYWINPFGANLIDNFDSCYLWLLLYSLN